MSSRAARRAPAPLLVLAAAMALATSACLGPLASPTPVPAASGAKTDMRSLSPFTTVSVSGPLNVVLAAGGAASVEVDGPPNIVPLVTTTVAGTELDVAVAAPGYSAPRPPTVRITAPALASVSLTDGATGTLEAMGQALSVSVSGGASLKGIGTVQQLTLAVLGNSAAELGDLVTETAAISIAGGATATLHAVKQLTGTADGGSVVTLVVAPAAKSVTVTGGAKIVEP